MGVVWLVEPEVNYGFGQIFESIKVARAFRFECLNYLLC